MGESGEDKLLPILEGKDEMTSSFFVEPLPSKHHTRANARSLGEYLVCLGYCQFVVKSDQEPALLALRETAVKMAEKELGDPGRITAGAFPVGSRESNGRAEAAARSMNDLVRAFLSSLEKRILDPVPLNHPIYV